MSSAAPLRIHMDRVRVELGGKLILTDISLHIEQGDKICVRGPSGSGKSTLLKTLLGLHPWTGHIIINGTELTERNLGVARNLAAYVSQEPVLGGATVLDALRLPFQFKAHRGTPPDTAEMGAILERLRLSPNLLNQSTATISGGEKQRVALARALLLRKTFLVLDEITSALDRDSRRTLHALLADPALTVLSVSHDPEWLAGQAQVYWLENGLLRREANPS